MLTVETLCLPTNFSPPLVQYEGQPHIPLPGEVMNCQTSERAASTARIADLDQLEARLQWQLGGRVRGLRLVGREEGLVIQGHTRTYYAKQLATHAAFDFDRELALTNDIEVG